MSDWNAFTVFQGSCTLDKAVFSATNLFQFTTWVDRLRADALQGGVPADRVNDVVRLLNKFFPPGSQPLLVAFNQPDPPNPSIDPDPEIVTYGNNEIRINDGPSALGYIFSIAASNAAFPRKYDNYAVPLLAMYSRCLYLAYILGDAGLPNDEGVPYMGNCIYTVIAGAEPGFDLLLGSTYQTIGDLRASKIQMMNRFRRGIVDGGLSQYNPVHTPPLEPRVYAGARLALKKYLRGLVPSKGGTNLWIPGTTDIAQGNPLVTNLAAQTSFNALATAWAAEWLTQKKTLIVPLTMLKAVSSQALTSVGGPSIAQAIENVLGQIVTKRWAADYHRATAWPELFPLVKEFYTQVYIPHMFPVQAAAPLKPDLTQPQVTMPDWPAAVDAVVVGILTAQREVILDKLDHLYSWISTGADNLSDGGPDRPRYGRCAETHPVVGLMPNYVPNRVISPAANPSPVRGFSVQILRFSNLVLPNVVTCNNLSLDGGFTSATLNAFHAAAVNDPVYRLPCDNCKILLPEMDAPMGQNAYYADMAALDPIGFPNIS